MLASLLIVMLLSAANPTPPRPVGGGGWITTDDYPAEARRYDREGTVAFTLAINADGRVTGCTITGSSGTSSLDAATCRLIRTRARFTPALNAVGQSVAGSFSSRIKWALPPKPLTPIASWSQLSRAVIDGSGKILSCTSTKEGAVPILESDFCSTVKDRSAMALAARGGSGRANVITYAQMRLSLDGQNPISAQHEKPGAAQVSLVRAHFDIRQDGLIANCEVEETRGVLGSIPICSELVAHFKFEAPEAANGPIPRRATMLVAFSTEPALPRQ